MDGEPKPPKGGEHSAPNKKSNKLSTTSSSSKSSVDTEGSKLAKSSGELTEKSSSTPTTNQPLNQVDDNAELLFQQVEEAELYSGLIPHPDHLERYNDIIPDGADRLMALVEKDFEHEREIAQLVTEANIRALAEDQRYRRIGQYIGGLLFFALMLASLAATYTPFPWLAPTIFSFAAIGAAVSFARPYLTGRKQKKDDDADGDDT